MVHIDSAKFGGYFCVGCQFLSCFYSVWDKQNYYWPSQFHAQKQVHEMMNNYASMCTHNTKNGMYASLQELYVRKNHQF